MAAKKVARQHEIAVFHGPEGVCVYLNGYRVRGPKPWGGGKLLYRWTFDDESMRAALKMASPAPGVAEEKKT